MLMNTLSICHVNNFPFLDTTKCSNYGNRLSYRGGGAFPSVTECRDLDWDGAARLPWLPLPTDAERTPRTSVGDGG